MKKVERILVVLTIIMFVFSIFSIGRVFASSDSLKITDVTINEKSSDVEATINSFSNDSINSNIKYHKLNGYVVYKIKLKNIDSEKHIIDFIADNNTNKSLQYDYSNYKNTIINPGEEVEIFIKESYVRENNDINNRIISSSVKFTFNLIDEDKKETIIDVIVDPIINPQTVDNIYLYFILSGVSLAILVLLGIKHKNKTGVKLFVTIVTLAILSIPVASKALESKDNIEFESSIGFYDKLKITYDIDGEKKTETLSYGKKLKREKDPVKEGYTFTGWYLNEEPFDFETPIKSDISLKATFKKNTYTITYNLNDGIIYNPTTFKVSELPIKLSNPYKDGYVFTGWTGSNGEIPNDNLTITKLSDNLEYTANFVPLTYTITYKGLNSSEQAVLNNPDAYTIEDVITLNNPTDILDGNNEVVYKFVGWKDEKGDISLNVTLNRSSENKTFEPIWLKMKSDIFSITYDLDGGSYVNSETNPIEYSSTTDTFVLNEPVKVGYNFIGWTGSNGDVPEKNLEITKGTTSNLSFVANYELITFNITYDLDGGSLTNENPLTYNYLDTFTLNNPSKEGYEFDGWTGTGVTNPSTNVTIPINSLNDRTYTAHYHEITYDITYTLNGGSVSGINPIHYKITDQVDLINPTKEGYTFLGWTGSNGDTPSDNVSFTNETGDKNYVANFTPNTYTIIFDKNDDSATGSMNSQEFTYDEAQNLSNIGFKKEGYQFIGWTTNHDGSGTGYSNKELVSNLVTEGSITLYAKWQKLVTAKFITGQDFNKRLSTLAGSLNKIEYIKFTTEPVDPSYQNGTYRISISAQSDVPIYMWWDESSKTMYYASDADVLYLNETCSYMFNNLTNVKEIDTHFDTSKCTNMQQMFYNNEKLESVTLSTFDTSSVTNMVSMFGHVQKFDGYDINGWDVSKVTNFTNMFVEAGGVTHLDLSNWHTDAAQQMEKMFSNANKLVEIHVDNFNTSNVTNMKKMFCDTKSLTSLDLSSFNTIKAGSMEKFFANTEKLTNLTLGPNFTIEKATTTSSMFNNTGLTTIDISMFNTAKVNTFSNMFDNSPNLTTIYVGAGFVTTGTTSNPTMFSGDTNLVGGEGTTYSDDHITKEYARVDDPDNNKPGYFTLKTNNN